MSIWQTMPWWEMLKKSNQVEKIIEINWIFIEKRKISLWKYGLFIIWLDEKLIELQNNKFFKDLKEICKKENCIFIQIETLNYNWINNTKKNPFSKDYTWGTKERGYFKSWYYKKFITPFTAIIDLTKNEDEILKEMKPKGRYNIKLAEKKWINIKEVEKTKQNVEIFYNLIKQTTTRNNFSWNTLEYYIKFLEGIKNAKLLLAYYNDIIIAWGIFIIDNEISIYYYWASTSNEKYRNLMAPFLIQWEAIKLAKNYWSKIYDFLWISSPNEKNSSLKWVTDFKMKLTKDIINVSDSYIYINNKIYYFIIKLLRKFK
jgi:lipid II:glycine glycyltransferase (peptidoglycan interpeptide bridge formation enzyme)